MNFTDYPTAPTQERSATLRWTPWLVFTVAILLLNGRLALEPVFGLWQGPFLDESDVWAKPLVSAWIQSLFLYLGGEAPLRAGSALSAVLGATVCGIAARLALAMAPSLPTPERVLAGLAAGMAMLLSAPLLLSGTAIGPTTLTLAAGATALAALFSAHASDRPWRALAISGAAAGIAAVNHPSFGLLLPILLLFALPASRILAWWPTSVMVIAVPFGLVSLLPYVAAMGAGETQETFWEHALRTPYPLIGSEAPDWGLAHWVPMPWGWPALALATLGATGIAFSGSARYTWPLLATALFFGPLLPSLTHHPALPAIPMDDQATRGLSLLAVILLATRGGLGISRALAQHKRTRSLYVSVLLSVFVGGMYAQAPARTEHLARDVGVHILEESPADAIVVCGDAYTASLLAATQHIEDIRNDVTIVPPHMLTSSHRRKALQEGTDIQIEEQFPPKTGWGSWSHQRPTEYLALLDLDGTAGAEGYFAVLDDLAQWDVVVQNHMRRPICFLGSSPDWLTARARRIDTMAQFPQVGRSPLRRERMLESWAVSEQIRREPGGSETLAPILSSVSEMARNQAYVEQAISFARAARECAPQNPELLLSAMRAAARTGDARGPGAIARADNADAAMPTVMAGWTDILKSDLTTAATERIWLGRDRPRLTESQARTALNQLWDADEVYMAERLAARAAGWYPETSSFQFDRAAALAQMGRIDDAEAAVRIWAEMVPLPWEVLELELKADGRFVLLEELLGPPEDPRNMNQVAYSANLGKLGNSGTVLAARR